MTTEPFNGEHALTAAGTSQVDTDNLNLLLPGSVPESEAADARANFRRGLELMLSGRHSEAVPYLDRALPTISQSTNDNIRKLISSLSNVARGIERLFQGDAHSAEKLLQEAARTADEVSLHLPELDTFAIETRANLYLASARVAMSAGDLARAQVLIGRIRAERGRILAKLRPDSQEYLLNRLTGALEQMEFIISMSARDLGMLDLQSARRRLEDGRESYRALGSMLKKLPEQGILRLLAEAFTETYSAIEKLHAAMEHFIARRGALNRRILSDFERGEQLLYDARERALTLAERGAGLLLVIDSVDKTYRNLVIQAKPAGKDFGRFSGLVSLAALIVLMVVVHTVIKPPSDVLLPFFFGCVILALVVGFGFGALRLLPLLRVWEDSTGRPQNAAPASKGDTDTPK
jgi:hypothetical protein